MVTKAPVSYYRYVPVATPAAGSNFTLIVPGQGLWRVISLVWTFTADATVADRSVSLIADDQTNTWFRSPSRVDVAANQASPQQAFAGASPGGFATSGVTMTLPPEGLFLHPGHRLRSSTINIQAGDQFSAIFAQVEEYPQGPDAEYLPTLQTQITAMG